MGLAPCGQLRILPVCRGRRCWISAVFHSSFLPGSAVAVSYTHLLARRLTEVYGIELKELEYGPGLPVCYFQSEKPMEEILESLKEGLKGLSFEGTVTLEMGRCIAAACGCLRL